MKQFRRITILFWVILLMFSFILSASAQDKPKTDNATQGSLGVAVDKPKTNKASEPTIKMEHPDHQNGGMSGSKMDDKETCTKHQADKAESMSKCAGCCKDKQAKDSDKMKEHCKQHETKPAKTE